VAQLQQGDVSKFRWSKVSTAALSRLAAPVSGFAGGTNPDFTLSPFAPSQQPTTGFLLQLQTPSVGGSTPNVGGFGVTPWLRDPATGFWSSWATQTMDFGQLFTTFDVDAAQLFFQFDGATVNAAGGVYIGIAEQ